MTIALPTESCKVYTPRELAAAIVRAMGDEPDALWLEPSHGRGAFVQALAEIGVPRSRIVAIDLDPEPADADKLAQTTRAVDFIQWAQATERRFDRIVGNPPYASIGQLHRPLRDTAARLPGPDGTPIGVGCNIWYAFVLASVRLLRCGGSLAFILPSAAEYADYSAAIRAEVRSTFQSLELYRCRRPLFREVQEGTVVAVARGYGEGPCRFRRREFMSPEGVTRALAARRLKAKRYCPNPCVTVDRSTRTLGDVAEIRLGGVTGDSKYFLLTETQRKKFDLPHAALTPVVSRARHLRSAVITLKEWEALRRADERVWLFNPTDALINNAAVKKRLKLSQDEGGCRQSAYKVMSRSPWYRTPLPELPHGFISGMGAAGPWIALNAMVGLNATNTLYVVTFRPSIPPEHRFQIALALLTSDAQRQLRRSARRYADGLVKYEPGALARIRLPQMQSGLDSPQIYLRAVSLLLDGHHRAAQRIADGCVSTAAG